MNFIIIDETTGQEAHAQKFARDYYNPKHEPQMEIPAIYNWLIDQRGRVYFGSNGTYQKVYDKKYKIKFVEYNNENTNI